MLKLKAVLEARKLPISAVAGECGISRTTLSLLVNEGRWPNKSAEKQALLQARLCSALVDMGVPGDELQGIFEVVREEPTPTVTPGPGATPAEEAAGSNEEEVMLLKKHTLEQGTRRVFQIMRDPFVDEVNGVDDLFLSPDMRYVAEQMLATARFGGMLAVVGESGGGKSTLRRALHDRIERENLPIVIVEPYVVAMEENDQRGKTLKSQHIAEALIAALQPMATLKSSPEARFAQLHRALKEAGRAGQRVVMVIEEAHCLPVPTLKHLKRFVELEDGFRKLLSVILVGQPELEQRLSERNPEVREVVQRCEIALLPPLDAALPAYVAHKLSRVGTDVSKVFDGDALEAMRERLTAAPQALKGGGRTRAVSLCYPLAVNNLATAAMNLAARIGSPRVTADIVREC